jgi:hypothetical protein
MWGGIKIFLSEDIPRRKAVMSIQRPFEATLKWFTQKLASGAAGFACRLGFCASTETMIHVFERMVAVWDSDPLALMFIAVFVMETVNVWGMLVSQVYGKPEAEPAIYSEFKKMPIIFKTTRLANQSDLSAELASYNENGYRRVDLLVQLGVQKLWLIWRADKIGMHGLSKVLTQH